MQNSRGFFLAEVMISISMLMLISTTFLPIYIHMNKQLRQVELDRKATHVLYETLQSFLLEGTASSGLVIRDRDEFTIEWEDRGVCVYYEDSFPLERKKCEILE